jgi:hypothetical protein
MVKAKTNYDKRMDDSRFENFDKVLDPSYGQKQFNILIIGIIVICCILFITTTLNYLEPTKHIEPSLYEDGLNISYIPSDKLFHITFSNPKVDTLGMSTIIKAPLDSTTSPATYITVYEYSTTEFPANITYYPSIKASSATHTVLITLLKSSGNYTYTYSIIPDTENRMWDGTGKYIEKLSEVFNIS